MSGRSEKHLDFWNWLLEVAEAASNGGLSLEDAIQAVRDGYASAEADRELRDHPEDL